MLGPYGFIPFVTDMRLIIFFFGQSRRPRHQPDQCTVHCEWRRARTCPPGNLRYLATTMTNWGVNACVYISARVNGYPVPLISPLCA